ncbi:hypothetical protein ACIOG4_37025 [Streptomyces microflavus]|uniref:hypothetical protein n=1 Tax=Streptomyces microflavus TaxID=1919 RepID=UPI0038088D7D
MATDPDAPATTALSYGSGNRWTFTSRSGGPTQTEELALHALPGGAEQSDGYLPDEITAEDLWAKWAGGVADSYHNQHPDQFRPGEIPIYWTVTRPGMDGIFEPPPHVPSHPENFLTHYTHPVNAVTEERLNWLRLPVLDREWNSTEAHKGGFIQQATGWKPSPLQPTMDIRQIGAAAGLYVPPL